MPSKAPSRTTTRRVAALSFVGAAVTLYATQAGHIPSFGLFERTGASTPAMTLAQTAGDDAAGHPGLSAEVVSVSASTAHVSDRFAKTQSHVLPQSAGFAAPPQIDGTDVARPTRFPEAGSIRPATTGSAHGLAPPRAPTSAGAEQQDQPTLSPLGLPCGLDITLAPAPNASIALGIAAPCHPASGVTIRHAGLTIGAVTDAVGLLAIDLPAFESPASVTVTLSDGTRDSGRLVVPQVDAFDRVALVSSAPGMDLHAMEGGAGWATPGHLHRGAPRTPSAAAEGLGYMTTFGGPGATVQVYSAPSGGQSEAQGVSFSVDAQVTSANCTRPAEASLLHKPAGGPVVETPLSFTFPGCDAVGSTLVLQNALGATRLAAN